MGGGKKILLRLLTIFFVFLISVGEVKSFGYPASVDGTNNWPISLNLGDSWFNELRQKWHRGHLGIDLVKDVFTDVYVSSNGQLDSVLDWVKCTGDYEVCDEYGCEEKTISNHGWGPTVVIRHEYSDGYNTEGTVLDGSIAEENPTVVYTQYGHLNSVDHLTEGQQVEKGEYLGQIGQICGWIPHLHFEIKDTEAVLADRANSAGAGFGYSGVDGYAPHQYIPQAFIDANQLVVTEASEESDSSQYVSVYQQIKDILGNAFGILNFGTGVAGQFVASGTDDVESSSAVTSDAEAPVYDANIAPANDIEVAVGVTEALIVVQAQNTGNTMWYRSNTSLNVVGTKIANAPFRHSTWLTDLRPTRLDQSEVPPGGIGTFTTLIRVPEGADAFVFLSQIVHQDGSTFLQVGTDFSAVHVRVEQVGDTDTSSETNPFSQSFFYQVEEALDDVIDDIADTAVDVFEDVVDSFQSVFSWGAGSVDDESESDDVPEDPLDEDVVIDVSIEIMSPTSTLHSTTSSLVVLGTMGADVTGIAVSSTASGTLTVDQDALSWTWIGEVLPGTSTITFVATGGGEYVRSTVQIQYHPTYVLDAVVLSDPTTSSVWYSNVRTTTLAGQVDARADSISIASGTSSAAISTPTTSWSFTAVHGAEGIYTYTLQASDTWGNVSPTSSLSVYVDDTAPTIVTTSIVLTTSTLSVVTVATDTFAGVALTQVEFRLGSIGVVGTCAAATTTFDYTVDADVSTSTCSWLRLSTSSVMLSDTLRGVSLVVRYRATDIAGNTGDWEYEGIAVPVEEVDGVTPTSVVFSQIAWMGTSASPNDEWIELYNQTAEDVNLYGWRITWGAYITTTDMYTHEILIDIPPEIPIDFLPTDEYGNPMLGLPAQQFITLERTSDDTISSLPAAQIYTGALENNGAILRLWNAEGVLMDEVDMSYGWAAGDNDTKESMVRVSPAVQGSSTDNWCSFLSCPVDSLAGNAEQLDADGMLINGSPRMISAPSIDPPMLEL